MPDSQLNSTSRKKSILNFNVQEWKVDMPAERILPPVIPKPPVNKGVIPPKPPVQPPPDDTKIIFNPPVITTVDNDDDDDIYDNEPKKKSRAWVWILIVLLLAAGIVAFVLNGGMNDLKGLMGETTTVHPVEEQIANMQNGQIIVFGSYPQARVTNSETLQELSALENGLEWQSYSYCSGDGYVGDNKGEGRYGSVYSDVDMNYADVTMEDGRKYRAVKILDYRPRFTALSSSAEHSYQDDYGYYINTTYWFQYQPLKWRVLDAEKGLMLCENIITATEFQSHVYSENPGSNATEYYQSSLFRSCAYFSRDAFTPDDARYIVHVKTDEDDTSDSYSYVLSSDDIVNTAYGFSASSDATGGIRCATATDYAKCQGVLADSYGNSGWWLRSGVASSDRIKADIVSKNGNLDSSEVTSTIVGLRPAVMIRKTS